MPRQQEQHFAPPQHSADDWQSVEQPLPAPILDTDRVDYALEPSTPAPNETSAEGAQPSPEDTLDTATRFTDVELLGKSYRVRRAVHELGNRRARKWESMKASTTNALETPGKLVRQGLHDRAKRKFEEADQLHKNKLAEIDAEINEVANNPDLYARQRNKKLEKLNKKRDKINTKHGGKVTKWQDRLTERRNVLNEQVSRMKNRREGVDKGYEKRRAELIATLKGKKELALARKTMRAELRRHSSRRETNEILREIPLDQRKRVGEAALLAYTANRAATKQEQAAAKAERDATRAEAALLANIQKSEELAHKARAADEAIRDIQLHSIPEAKEKLQSLQDQLDTMDANDPSREAIRVQIHEAEDQLRLLTERELPYWHAEALKQRDAINTLYKARQEIQQQALEAKDEAAKSLDEVEQSRREAAQYTARQQEAITETLNAPERNES